MHQDESIWLRRGAILSDLLVRTEFGLTQLEILAAIHAGKLHYQIAQNAHGPYFLLLRDEVEALVTEKREKGPPPPMAQLLELTLAEMDQVFANIIGVFSLGDHGEPIHDALAAYHHILNWIAHRNRSLTSPNHIARYKLLTKMKRELRSALRGGTQPFQQIDIANSQWMFLALQMRKDGIQCEKYFALCELGELYEVVAKYANTTREKVKEGLTQRALFSANEHNSQGSKIKRTFDGLFPEVAMYLYEAKRHQGDDSGLGQILRRAEHADGRRLAEALHFAESQLMVDNVCGRFRREKKIALVIRVLDSLVFPPSDRDYVQEVLKEEFERLGVRPRLKVKDL